MDVDTVRHPQRVHGEVGEICEDGHGQPPAEPQPAQDTAGSRIGGDDRTCVGVQRLQHAVLGGAQQRPRQRSATTRAFGAAVDPLVGPGGQDQHPVVSVPDERSHPGGQQIQQVEPVDGEAVGGEPTG